MNELDEEQQPPSLISFNSSQWSDFFPFQDDESSLDFLTSGYEPSLDALHSSLSLDAMAHDQAQDPGNKRRKRSSHGPGHRKRSRPGSEDECDSEIRRLQQELKRAQEKWAVSTTSAATTPQRKAVEGEAVDDARKQGCAETAVSFFHFLSSDKRGRRKSRDLTFSTSGGSQQQHQQEESCTKEQENRKQRLSSLAHPAFHFTCPLLPAQVDAANSFQRVFLGVEALTSDSSAFSKRIESLLKHVVSTSGSSPSWVESLQAEVQFVVTPDDMLMTHSAKFPETHPELFAPPHVVKKQVLSDSNEDKPASSSSSSSDPTASTLEEETTSLRRSKRSAGPPQRFANRNDDYDDARRGSPSLRELLKLSPASLLSELGITDAEHGIVMMCGLEMVVCLSTKHSIYPQTRLPGMAKAYYVQVSSEARGSPAVYKLLSMDLRFDMMGCLKLLERSIGCDIVSTSVGGREGSPAAPHQTVARSNNSHRRELLLASSPPPPTTTTKPAEQGSSQRRDEAQQKKVLLSSLQAANAAVEQLQQQRPRGGMMPTTTPAAAAPNSASSNTALLSSLAANGGLPFPMTFPNSNLSALNGMPASQDFLSSFASFLSHSQGTNPSQPNLNGGSNN